MAMTTLSFAVGLWVASLMCSTCQSSFVTDEKSLRTALLTNYDSEVRPGLKTNINIGFALSSLQALDIAKQYMSVVGLIRLAWYDSRLAWNSSSYGGLEFLVVAPERIWTPPVVIENAMDTVGVIGGSRRDGVPLRISSMGQVIWTPPQLITTSCEMAIAHYPFDTQRCTIVFLGWSYPLSEMEIKPVSLDTSSLYSANGEFDLIDTNIFESDLGGSQRRNETYRKLMFELTFRRKWQFYGQNLVLPIVLNSIMMNVVFVLPIESGEKMGYSLTVLLTYIVFLTWVTENLPPVSTDTSILQVYLAIVLAMGCLATLLTTWVLHLYHTDPDKPMGTAYRLIARNLLERFKNCVYCRRRKTTKVTITDDYDTRAPDHVAFHDNDSKPSVNAPDLKRAFGGFEGDKGVGEGKEPRTYTWQELAKLLDCFFLWSFAFLILLLTTVITSMLYGSYY